MSDHIGDVEKAATLAGQALAEIFRQRDYWQEEARRYAQNADFWRGRYEALLAPSASGGDEARRSSPTDVTNVGCGGCGGTGTIWQSATSVSTCMACSGTGRRP